MAFFPAALDNLIDRFASLPGIGRKSAQRLAFYVLSLPDEEALAFADTIRTAKKGIVLNAGQFFGKDYGSKYSISFKCIIADFLIGVKELLIRASNEEVREVIMATNPDTEGEATAIYISRLLKPFGLKVTRLAYGIPVGSNLEFADDATLTRALEGRTEI